MIRHKISFLVLSPVIAGLILVACDSPFGPYDEGSGQAPFELTALFLGKAINLNWYATADSEESAYIVYRSEGDPYHYEEVAHITGWITEYRDTDIEVGKLYYYKVKTEYDGNPGKDSNEVTEYTASNMLWFTTFYGSPPIGEVYAYNPGTDVVHSISEIWELDNYGIHTPYGICSDGEYIYLSNFDIGDTYTTYLSKIDRTSGNIVNTVGPRDYFYRLTFDGGELWSCINGDQLLRIEPESGNIIDQIDVTRYSYHGLTSFGGYVWGLRIYIGDSHIYQMDRNDGSLVNTLFIDLDYPGLAYDGEYLWGVYRKITEKNTVFDLCRINRATGGIVDHSDININGPGTIIDMEIIPSKIPN